MKTPERAEFEYNDDLYSLRQSTRLGNQSDDSDDEYGRYKLKQNDSSGYRIFDRWKTDSEEEDDELDDEEDRSVQIQNTSFQKESDADDKRDGATNRRHEKLLLLANNLINWDGVDR
jgi:hypothetical protein